MAKTKTDETLNEAIRGDKNTAAQKTTMWREGKHPVRDVTNHCGTKSNPRLLGFHYKSHTQSEERWEAKDAAQKREVAQHKTIVEQNNATPLFPPPNQEVMKKGKIQRVPHKEFAD